jgi:hypothetical protein
MVKTLKDIKSEAIKDMEELNIVQMIDKMFLLKLHDAHSLDILSQASIYEECILKQDITKNK